MTSLVRGVVDTGAGDQRTIRFAGQGLNDNNLTLDGVDATAVFNQMQREYVRLTAGVDWPVRREGSDALRRRRRRSRRARRSAALRRILFC